MGNMNPAPRTLLEALVLTAQPIEVELATVLVDGKPARVRMRQPTPLEWSKRGRSFPITSGKRVVNILEDPAGEADAMQEWHEYGCLMLQAAIYEAELPTQTPNGDWTRTWTAARLVESDAVPQDPYDAVEIPMRLFDQADNVRRCFDPLLAAFSRVPSQNGNHITPEDLREAPSEAGSSVVLSNG